MLKVLVPVDTSANSGFAIRHVVKEFMKSSALEVHLLNVQPPFWRDITQFISQATLEDYYRTQSDKVLRRYSHALERHGIPHSVHRAVGHQAECIAAAARRLGCGLILMSTARKNSLTRLVERSVTNRVVELASVPVEIIPGRTMSPWERFGIPLALAALLAVIFAATN